MIDLNPKKNAVMCAICYTVAAIYDISHPRGDVMDMLRGKRCRWCNNIFDGQTHRTVEEARAAAPVAVREWEARGK